ncbi:hypothetical protein BDV28DRAFT_147635 [Aspergillus coremiiformis]|uniref:Uncharacterized protein n=1 Tax=Aspergillus coremiiformis TaxID=138285 RepID=A0A5N6Z871_9EURO|nr:hypothetical protein BDV28DRAFT_147635 [Aspergillus coremiiformis]
MFSTVLSLRRCAARINPDKIESISNYPSATLAYAQAPKEVLTASCYPRKLPRRLSLERPAVDLDEQSSASEESSNNDDSVEIKDEGGTRECYESDNSGDTDDTDDSVDSDDISAVPNTPVDYMGDDNGAIGRYYWGYAFSHKLKPEAAATYVLAKTDEILPNDCFTLLDTGGGTLDVITYKVRKVRLLRLEREEGELVGALCGSSYLNERFETLMFERFKK